MEIEIRKRIDGTYDFHITNKGHEICNSNQGYENYFDCEDVALHLQSNIAIAPLINATGEKHSRLKLTVNAFYRMFGKQK